ncbi:MAG: hypothetical protein IJA60_04150 [Clostridia bacterium]|nr:hypothetical protein [Clostridia bacterium]
MDTEIVTTATEVVTEAANAASMFGDITFEPMNFVSNLGYMATGMVGIFVVIGAIILVTSLMNKISTKNK